MILNKTLALALAFGGALALAQPAGAISITIDSLANNGGATAPVLTESTGRHVEHQRQISTLDAGGSGADTIGTIVDARTRYASMTTADTGSLSLGQVLVAVNDYKITFTVNAPANVQYSLAINTSRVGALTIVSDSGANGPATADLSAVSGLLNSVGEAGLGLADIAPTSVGGNSGASANTPFSQSNSVTLLSLTGNNTITLDFSWTSYVNSNPGANTTTTNAGNGSFLFGGDEASVRMGLSGDASPGAGGVTSDDYPGAGARNQALDGHIVGISAQVTAIVPEPGTLAMLGLGLAGIARAGRKRGA